MNESLSLSCLRAAQSHQLQAISAVSEVLLDLSARLHRQSPVQERDRRIFVEAVQAPDIPAQYGRRFVISW
jgi:hypothetical protein